ncbi:hypothetical protein QS460_04880 [Liquorilactobacillus mali]|uniref:hypothetical protein n=1 Tax=Liquorilactobacillus mali TaxID=1618 RepID=UPI00264B2FC1|nr:hypothetical protein [Liquorilactobacillus mali]MDN7145258.1 hypothetical protein [Liquorilactobacillus mali]
MVNFSNPPTLDILDEPENIAGAESYAQKNHNWYVIRNYGTSVGTFLQGALDGFQLRFDNMLQNAEQVNEVVDARVDVNQTVFSTLKARLDAQQEASATVSETGVYSDSICDLQILDLDADSSTNTASLSYDKIATVADPTASSSGFASYKLGSSITID